MNSYNSPTTQPIFRTSQVVWSILAIVEMTLLFRFFLKAFGANAEAGFSSFVYSVSAPVVAPFSTVFPLMETTGSTLEWTTTLAMAVYWIIAASIARLLVMSLTVSTPEAAGKLADETGSTI